MGQSKNQLPQKRQSSQPQGQKSQVPANPSSYGINLPQSRIIGLSKDGLIVVALIASLYGNYRLFKGVEGLNGKVSALEYQMAQTKEREIQITLKQEKGQKDQGLDISSQLAKLQDSIESSLKNEMDKRFENLKRPASSPYQHLHRQPASLSLSSKGNHLNQLRQIDISNFNVKNLNSYDKYHYFLSEQSRLYRNMRAKVSDIISDYAKSHHITGQDRTEYYGLLEARDGLMNRLKDLQAETGKRWLKRNRKLARR